MYIEQIPKHAPKQMKPRLKVGDLVKTTQDDYSQEKGGFSTKRLPAGSIGRIKKIFAFGSRVKSHRFLCDIKFEGHPITNFYSEELVKVRV
jgi:hypothetical protein